MSKKERLETPLEKEERENKLISFSERWEEELKEKLFNLTDPENPEVHTVIQEKYEWHHERPDEEWDVPITEEIKYFDPELSYELTGYRPLTMEKSLDFDPEPFRYLAEVYERSGKYMEFPVNSKPYRDFWNDVIDKCNNGYQVGKYRVTGDHFFFLNFYRMQVINEKAIGGEGRLESFPSFIAKQYEWFHYVEMAEKLHKDVGALKSRGVGWSEMTASMAVRPYTTKRGYNVMLTAFDDIKLSGLKQKCWFQLDWLNLNTSGGLRHIRQKYNNDDTKKASMVTVDGTEKGWMSMITCVIANTSDKVRGPRLDRLVYEEAGSNKILAQSWIKGNALVELGGFHLGTRIFLGTGR